MSSVQEKETITLTRDCNAVLVPQGDHVVVTEGAEVTITQALGGSYTVYLKGHLLRIDGTDADALGKTVAEAPPQDSEVCDADVEQAVWNTLKTCFDPEIPINIVDLGLVYSCCINAHGGGERTASIEMTLTAPGCGMGEVLVQDVRGKVGQIPGITRVQVELVFDPPWNMEKMSMEARLQAGLI